MAITTTEVDATDLTAFQMQCLRVMGATGGDYGLGIKRELEARYGEEVNHGRLYPNLDDLVQSGLVEKSEIDRRTNGYELTEKGQFVLVDELGAFFEDVAGFSGHHALEVEGFAVDFEEVDE
ncbi:PadR family transcriptional regulator [Halomarina oriensis]|uniref:PadR family transcriptional regulator n=1 Tax=Halomarina oriensis TaxID=671145 RepID=A0A6B0GRU4_9EURY|nr:PadR family transcriptional regulator [Halomarina oriensis]MWG34795.1 PadR family transcriptional regulator [Halomarina oriensis]